MSRLPFGDKETLLLRAVDIQLNLPHPLIMLEKKGIAGVYRGMDTFHIYSLITTAAANTISSNIYSSAILIDNFCSSITIDSLYHTFSKIRTYQLPYLRVVNSCCEMKWSGMWMFDVCSPPCSHASSKQEAVLTVVREWR